MNIILFLVCVIPSLDGGSSGCDDDITGRVHRNRFRSRRTVILSPEVQLHRWNRRGGGGGSSPHTIRPAKHVGHIIRIRQKRRQRSSLLVADVLECRTSHLAPGWFKKSMKRRTDTWRNGCFGKMDDHPVHSTPNHHSPKMDVLSKTFSSNHPCCYITRSATFKYVPQPAATTFTFPAVWFLFYMMKGNEA